MIIRLQLAPIRGANAPGNRKCGAQCIKVAWWRSTRWRRRSARSHDSHDDQWTRIRLCRRPNRIEIRKARSRGCRPPCANRRMAVDLSGRCVHL